MQKLSALLSIAILLAFAPPKSFSQKKFPDDAYYSGTFTSEIGTSLGFMNCLTDLGGGKGVGKKFIKDVNIGNTGPEGSIYYSVIYKYAVALRTEATWGIVKAKDALQKSFKETTGGRYERNLSFRSSIFEIALITEIHPRFFKTYTPDDKFPRLSPYLLGGIGYFSFNPRARLDSAWVDLRPLHTEGEGFSEYPDRKEYKLKQINFPVGAGLKYKIAENVTFSAECVYRILMTDYLDDVSTRYVDRNVFSKYFSGAQLAQVLALQDRQHEITPNQYANPNDVRGDSKKNDAYFSINFKIGFIF